MSPPFLACRMSVARCQHGQRTRVRSWLPLSDTSTSSAACIITRPVSAVPTSVTKWSYLPSACPPPLPVQPPCRGSASPLTRRKSMTASASQSDASSAILARPGRLGERAWRSASPRPLSAPPVGTLLQDCDHAGSGRQATGGASCLVACLCGRADEDVHLRAVRVARARAGSGDPLPGEVRP